MLTERREGEGNGAGLDRKRGIQSRGKGGGERKINEKNRSEKIYKEIKETEKKNKIIVIIIIKKRKEKRTQTSGLTTSPSGRRHGTHAEDQHMDSL